MDIDTRELALLAAMGCFGLLLAWTTENNLFAAVFAAEAAFAVVGTAYRS